MRYFPFSWQETGFQATKKSYRWSQRQFHHEAKYQRADWNFLLDADCVHYLKVLTRHVSLKPNTNLAYCSLINYQNRTSLNMLLIWEMNLEDMNYSILSFEHYDHLNEYIRSNWDSIGPKPWEGFVGSWHCFISDICDVTMLFVL